MKQREYNAIRREMTMQRNKQSAAKLTVKQSKQRNGIRRDRVNKPNNIKQRKTNETTPNDAEALKNRQR